MECPACHRLLSVPAREGGLMIKARYVRLTEDHRLVIGCPHCKAEVPTTAPLRLSKLRRAATSAGASGATSS